MKLVVFARQSAAWLACVGMLVPAAAWSAGPQTNASQASNYSLVKDVALTTQGTLRGQIVDATGAAVAGSRMVVRQGSNTVIELLSDQDGRFAVSGLKGGTYELAAENAAGVYRVWPAEAAPPIAVNQVLLVDSRSAVIRGADGVVYGGSPPYGGGPPVGGPPVGGGVVGYGPAGGAPCGPDGCGGACGPAPCPPPCGPCGGGPANGFLGIISNPWIVGAAVAAAIAIPLAVSDDDDDNAS